MLNTRDTRNKSYLLYWMQSSQRAEHNLALTYAIYMANKLNKPLMVFFGIDPAFPEANIRHYYFMLEGLKETINSLQKIGIKTIIRNIPPQKGIIELSKDSCFTVTDKGYLNTLKEWYAFAAKNIKCPLVQVEDNVVVPLEEASGKAEYSAATLRPKISKKKYCFLSPSSEVAPNRNSSSLELDSLDLANPSKMLSALRVDATVTQTKYFKGGTSEAKKNLDFFIRKRLADYAELRNDPVADCHSNLSPYLHFGQISPIFITSEILGAPVSQNAKEVYLDELIIRRELAMNYIHYNSDYDSFLGLPNWAKITLCNHKKDKKEYVYSLTEFENAKTHDPYWNAAQNEMRIKGKMHGYMRMYWGKKFIEWSENPETAFKIALYLNNKYEIDGRDPNGYAGVAWCFGKHDRPWKERPIFGKVRYMNQMGLRRKFDADKYVEKINNL